jgi:glycogen synthase
MRILYLSIEYPPESPNGIGSYVVEMAAALARRGHEVHVLSCMPGQEPRDYRDGPVFLHRRGEPSGPHLERATGGPHTAARIRHALACWREARALKVDFDVIESPDWMAEGLVFSLARRPVLVHLHTPLRLTSRFSAQRSGRDLRLADWLERLTVIYAQAITAPSKLVTEKLRDDAWLGGRAVEVARNPMNLERWLGAKSVAETAPVALFTGRLERLKAPEVLVDAMAYLAGRIRGAEAWLAGRSAGAAADGRPLWGLARRARCPPEIPLSTAGRADARRSAAGVVVGAGSRGAQPLRQFPIFWARGACRRSSGGVHYRHRSRRDLTGVWRRGCHRAGRR